MFATLSIIVSKLITLICKLFGKEGSVFPASIALKIDKNVLDKIKYPKYVVGVTGSSGKGSTVDMISHILNVDNKKIVWNKSGSNVKNGIATLILNNTKIFTHKLNADVLLLEIDESYLSSIFKEGVITHLVLTNMTRDQPARNMSSSLVFKKILKGINDKMHIIVNVDDPLLNRIKYLHKGEITTYGINQTKYDEEVISYLSMDNAYCPLCDTKLEFKTLHYGNEGIYKCPRCEFERGTPDYMGDNLDLENGTLTINNNLVKLNKNVFFAAYYTLAAYALASTININKSVILDALNDKIKPSKRMKIYNVLGRNIEMLESKNENALSYLQSLNYIKSINEKKSIIMGFENVSRRYEFNDLSWLYDVNFELLNNDDNIDKIFLIGRFKKDVYLRLSYAGIDLDKCILIDDTTQIMDTVLKNSKGNIYTMVCFDMTEIIKKQIEENLNE